MTPVERLQAAIEKLESLRAGSQNWRVRLSSEEGPEVVHDFPNDDYGPGTGTLAWTITAESAINIVTLHRTIEAQLAILRSSAERGAAAIEAGVYEPFVWSSEHRVLALADAILGGDS